METSALLAAAAFHGSPFLALMIVLGLIPAMIAAHKGRNFLVWWLYGALLPLLPIAFVHALLAKDLTRRPCPICAESILPAALVCPHCHGAIPQPR